jgi:GT2 family glycosyltransferase
MNVSVIICAYTLDRWDSLVDAVQSCTQQTDTPSEILVVIDYNEELFERASRELVAARVLKNQFAQGLSGARNTGVVNSAGEVVVFLDDDAYAEPSWLHELVASMIDPKIAGTGGWVVPHWETEPAPWFPKSFFWILGCSYSGLPSNGATIRNPIGANMAIRRRVFSTVGGFTSGIGRIGTIPLGCEETELCIRFSKQNPDERFQLARDAIVHHRVPASRLTWHYFWTRCWAEGLSKAAVASLVGSGLGLSAERSHVTRALPREIGQATRQFARRPKVASVQATLIVVGTFIAAGGYLRGRLALQRTPLTSPNQEAMNLLDLPSANP